MSESHERERDPVDVATLRAELMAAEIQLSGHRADKAQSDVVKNGLEKDVGRLRKELSDTIGKLEEMTRKEQTTRHDLGKGSKMLPGNFLSHALPFMRTALRSRRSTTTD